MSEEDVEWVEWVEWVEELGSLEWVEMELLELVELEELMNSPFAVDFWFFFPPSTDSVTAIPFSPSPPLSLSSSSPSP